MYFSSKSSRHIKATFRISRLGWPCFGAGIVFGLLSAFLIDFFVRLLLTFAFFLDYFHPTLNLSIAPDEANKIHFFTGFLSLCLGFGVCQTIWFHPALGSTILSRKQRRVLTVETPALSKALALCLLGLLVSYGMLIIPSGLFLCPQFPPIPPWLIALFLLVLYVDLWKGIQRVYRVKKRIIFIVFAVFVVGAHAYTISPLQAGYYYGNSADKDPLEEAVKGMLLPQFKHTADIPLTTKRTSNLYVPTLDTDGDTVIYSDWTISKFQETDWRSDAVAFYEKWRAEHVVQLYLDRRLPFSIYDSLTFVLKREKNFNIRIMGTPPGPSCCNGFYRDYGFPVRLYPLLRDQASKYQIQAASYPALIDSLDRKYNVLHMQIALDGQITLNGTVIPTAHLAHRLEPLIDANHLLAVELSPDCEFGHFVSPLNVYLETVHNLRKKAAQSERKMSFDELGKIEQRALRKRFPMQMIDPSAWHANDTIPLPPPLPTTMP